MNRFVPLIILFAAFCLAPFAIGKGQIYLLIEILAMLCIAQSWNLLAGYGGLLSLGHHAFVGVGAYSLFVLSSGLGISPYLIIPVSGLTAAILAVALTPILFRLKTVYFAIGMWVAAEIVKILVTRLDVLGATSGLPLIAARTMNRDWLAPNIYWIALACAALIVGGLIWLEKSPYGSHVKAFRDDETAARSLGVDSAKIKSAIFILSAVGCGIAGAVHFMAAFFVSPTAAFDINWTVASLFICVIGGLGTVWGPVIGTIVYFTLREALAFSSGYYLITMGCVAVIVMVFAPKGLVGLLNNFTSNLNIRKR